MKKNVIDRERLKSILLNHLYSKGNVVFLMEHTVLKSAVAARDLDKRCVTLDTHLDPDHWAFKQVKKSARFRVREMCDEVYDTYNDHTIATFFTRKDADDYATLRNNLHTDAENYAKAVKDA